MTPKVADEKKDERRSQILQAAMSCFAEKGYHLTTMDDIVAASGLSKGSIYWYYKSKKDILMAILEVAFAEIGEAAAGILEDSTVGAGERLRRFLEVSMESIAQFGELTAVFIDFWSASRHDEDFYQLMVGLYEPFLKSMVALIEEGIQSGEFRPVNAADLAVSLMSAGDGLIMYQIIGIPVDLQGTMETFLDVLFEGLRPR
jgi:AcrR family transcriptional regulator